jgi:hypothetical protein
MIRPLEYVNTELGLKERPADLWRDFGRAAASSP